MDRKSMNNNFNDHDDKDQQSPTHRPFVKRWYVLLLLSGFVLLLISELLSGSLQWVPRHTLDFGALLLFLYLWEVVGRRNLSPWWSLVVVMPMVLISLLNLDRPFRWLFTSGYIVLGFLGVLAIHWDRKRRKLP